MLAFTRTAVCFATALLISLTAVIPTALACSPSPDARPEKYLGQAEDCSQEGWVCVTRLVTPSGEKIQTNSVLDDGSIYNFTYTSCAEAPIIGDKAGFGGWLLFHFLANSLFLIAIPLGVGGVAFARRHSKRQQQEKQEPATPLAYPMIPLSAAVVAAVAVQLRIGILGPEYRVDGEYCEYTTYVLNHLVIPLYAVFGGLSLAAYVAFAWRDNPRRGAAVAVAVIVVGLIAVELFAIDGRGGGFCF